MAIAVLVGLGLGAFPARLEAAEGGVSLSLSAPAACPPRESLVSNVSARTPEAAFVEGAAALEFRVRIGQTTRGFVAAVETRIHGDSETRRLQGATCAELVDAVGLVIALTIDPDAVRSLPAEEATRASIAEVTPRASSPPSVAKERDAPPARDVAVPPAAASRARWVPFVRGGIQAELGTLPYAALGVFGAVGVELERGPAALAPSFAFEPSFATSDAFASAPARGSYMRGAARVEACPLRFVAFGASLRPCAWMGAGLVRAEDTAAPVPEVRMAPWADAGARLRFRGEFGRRLFVEVDAGAVVPITRPTFVLEQPRSIVYATPAVGGTFALGGGVRFW